MNVLPAAAGRDAQLALIRAHHELAGKAMVSQTLTAESTNEQGKAGLTDCTPEEFARIQRLNADYNAKFGFPFILAVRGPRGLGLNKAEIIATFARRLDNHPDFELAECLRNIHRIAELRLNDKFGHVPELGNRVWDWADALDIARIAGDVLGPAGLAKIKKAKIEKLPLVKGKPRLGPCVGSVRHFVAIGVHESFEVQTIADRLRRADMQAVSNDRTAAAAARHHGDGVAGDRGDRIRCRGGQVHPGVPGLQDQRGGLGAGPPRRRARRIAGRTRRAAIPGPRAP